MPEKKFIATKELGKLAKWLRILGYDCDYYRKDEVAGAVIEAIREERILLTRKGDYKKYKGIKTLLVSTDHAEEQIEEVFTSLGLEVKEEELFTRCIDCNESLEGVAKGKVKEEVPEYVYKTQKFFKRCPKCDKIFWKGSHWDLVKEWLEKRK